MPAARVAERRDSAPRTAIAARAPRRGPRLGIARAAVVIDAASASSERCVQIVAEQRRRQTRAPHAVASAVRRALQRARRMAATLAPASAPRLRASQLATMLRPGLHVLPRACLERGVSAAASLGADRAPARPTTCAGLSAATSACESRRLRGGVGRLRPAGATRWGRNPPEASKRPQARHQAAS